MPREPGSPGDRLRFARSDLAIARVPVAGDVLREALCFHARQAAEKSLKAVLLKLGIAHPRTHNLKTLLSLLPQSLAVPPDVAASAELSDYAVTARYPGEFEEVTEAEHQEALRLAETVVAWASAVVGS